MPPRLSPHLRHVVRHGAALLGSRVVLLARASLTASIGPGFPSRITLYPALKLAPTSSVLLHARARRAG